MLVVQSRKFVCHLYYNQLLVQGTNVILKWLMEMQVWREEKTKEEGRGRKMH